MNLFWKLWKNCARDQLSAPVRNILSVPPRRAPLLRVASSRSAVLGVKGHIGAITKTSPVVSCLGACRADGGATGGGSGW